MRRTLWVGLLIIAAALASACAPRHPVLVSGDGLQQDPRVVHGVLNNGFQYLLLHNETPKDRVIVHLNIFAGSVHETDQELGVAHYLEHMLFNGSEHFKPGELVEYFQSIGMDFGADANASTSFFTTKYDLNLPKGDRAHLEKGLLVMSDYAKGALLLEGEVARERGIILAEKRERDSTSYRMFKDSLDFQLPGSLLTRRYPIGTTEVISSTDRALLKGFYDRWYRPDNMVLVVVGDFDVQEAEILIKERFSGFQPRGGNFQSAPDLAWTPHKGVNFFYDYEPEAGNTTVTLERIHRVPFEAETLDGIKQSLLEDIADAAVQTRLDAMVRSQSSGFSSASVYSGRFFQEVYAAVMSADCDPGNWKLSLIQLEKTLAQMLRYGVDPGELSRIKADLMTQLKNAVKKSDTQRSKDLARALLSAVNRKEVFQSPAQQLALLGPFIESITVADVNKTFRRTWDGDHRLILVTGNVDLSADGPSPEGVIKAAYAKAVSQDVQPYAQPEQKDFPYLPLPEKKAGVIRQLENVGDLGITTLEFENHIRINLKPTDLKKGEFLFKATFGNGIASEPRQIPGLHFLAESTLANTGLGQMTADQLEDALAGRDAGIEFSIGENYFALGGTASPDEAELAFQLIYAFLKDPGFGFHGLELAKTLYRQRYEAAARTPDGVMSIQGNRALAENDPRFGLPHPDGMDRVSLEQIRDWLLPAFASAPVEISIVGDFNLEEVIAKARTYVGALERRERIMDKTVYSPQKAHFAKGSRIDLPLDSRIKKGMVRVVFQTDDFWDINQTRQLSVLSQVLSERLRKVIREKLGATYSPYVYNDPSLIYKGYGTLHLVVNVEPGTETVVVDAVQGILKDVRENGISEKEVALTLKPFVTHLKELRQRNSYWLNSVLVNSGRHPERLNWAKTILNGYADTNAKDLMALVRQYLPEKAEAVVQILPPKAPE